MDSNQTRGKVYAVQRYARSEWRWLVWVGEGGWGGLLATAAQWRFSPGRKDQQEGAVERMPLASGSTPDQASALAAALAAAGPGAWKALNGSVREARTDAAASSAAEPVVSIGNINKAPLRRWVVWGSLADAETASDRIWRDAVRHSELSRGKMTNELVVAPPLPLATGIASSYQQAMLDAATAVPGVQLVEINVAIATAYDGWERRSRRAPPRPRVTLREPAANVISLAAYRARAHGEAR